MGTPDELPDIFKIRSEILLAREQDSAACRSEAEIPRHLRDAGRPTLKYPSGSAKGGGYVRKKIKKKNFTDYCMNILKEVKIIKIIL